MLIKIDPLVLHHQDFDAALRMACDDLSHRGVKNFIHYTDQRIVELFDPPKFLHAEIDYVRRGVSLVAIDEQ